MKKMLLICLLWFLGVQVTAARECDLASADAHLDALLQQRPDLAGAALLIGDANGVVHRRFFGEYDDSTRVPLASASKLLSSMLMLRLVDAGLLSLEQPLHEVLPSFRGPKGRMTLAQMLSHTSGLPGNRNEDGQRSRSNWILSAPVTLMQAVQWINCCTPLLHRPGSAFAYGGQSMQVAGGMAERVTGMDFQQFAQQELALLDVHGIDYQGLKETVNYRLGAGARSSLDDYGRVMSVLLNGGRADAVEFLSPTAWQAMLSDHRLTLDNAYTPPSARADGYGLGLWLQYDDDGALLSAHSRGAFDFYPWVDFISGHYAVLMLENHGASLRQALAALRLLIDAEMHACLNP